MNLRQLKSLVFIKEVTFKSINFVNPYVIFWVFGDLSALSFISLHF